MTNDEKEQAWLRLACLEKAEIYQDRDEEDKLVKKTLERNQDRAEKIYRWATTGERG